MDMIVWYNGKAKETYYVETDKYLFGFKSNIKIGKWQDKQDNRSIWYMNRIKLIKIQEYMEDGIMLESNKI